MSTKKTDPISLRIPEDLQMRVERMQKKSGLSKAAILQLCVRAGLPELESGRVNLIATSPCHLSEAKGVAEEPKKRKAQ